MRYHQLLSQQKRRRLPRISSSLCTAINPSKLESYLCILESIYTIVNTVLLGILYCYLTPLRVIVFINVYHFVFIGLTLSILKISQSAHTTKLTATNGGTTQCTKPRYISCPRFFLLCRHRSTSRSARASSTGASRRGPWPSTAHCSTCPSCASCCSR